MLFSSRFWLVTSKNIYLKKKKTHLGFLIDLFLFRKAEMELILNGELVIASTADSSTTIGKKKEHFPEQSCSERRTKALMENGFQMIIFTA